MPYYIRQQLLKWRRSRRVPPAVEAWDFIDPAFKANQTMDTVYTAEDDYTKAARHRRENAEQANVTDMAVIATGCLKGDVDPDNLPLQVRKALRVYLALMERTQTDPGKDCSTGGCGREECDSCRTLLGWGPTHTSSLWPQSGTSKPQASCPDPPSAAKGTKPDTQSWSLDR